MNIKIECFMKAAETLNFTEAANQLFITQPAFSRNIAALERELGIQLFIRNVKARAVRLTVAGAAYYDGLRKLKESYAQLLVEVNEMDRAEKGELSVGVLTGCLMDDYIQCCLEAFKNKHPKVVIRLCSCSFHELVENLYSGEIDLSMVLYQEVKDLPEILSETLYSVESYLFVPRKMGHLKKESHSIREFAEETFIVSKDTPRLTELLKQTCNQAGFEPIILEAPNFETQMLWVENGMGVAGNSRGHMLISSANVDFFKIQEFIPMDYVAAWNRRNYNPLIASFTQMHNIIN